MRVKINIGINNFLKFASLFIHIKTILFLGPLVSNLDVMNVTNKEAVVVFDAVPRALMYSITTYSNNEFVFIRNDTRNASHETDGVVVNKLSGLNSSTSYKTYVTVHAEPTNGLSLTSPEEMVEFQTSKILY